MVPSDHRPPLPQARGVSLADQARETIRSAILDGSFQPGERLTIERLAAELGVSRTPVREALKALEGDGLLRLIPHRGAVVAPFARDEVYHRYAIRAMLEGYAAELACRREVGALADELEAHCSELRALVERADQGEPVETSQFADLNRDFHRAIREGSGSATLIRLLRGLSNPLSFTLAHWSDPVLRRSSLESHVEIAAAFRSRDAQAARQLTEHHLLAARDYLMSGHVARTACSLEGS